MESLRKGKKAKRKNGQEQVTGGFMSIDADFAKEFREKVNERRKKTVNS